MPELAYSIGFLFSAGVFVGGRYMVNNEQMAKRIFFWGPSFVALYFRFAGKFFLVGGIIGMIFFPILMVLHFI